MDLETRKSSEILFIQPQEKRIDASTATVFKGKVTDLIVRGEKLLVINLAKVEFIDSSGLGALISLIKTLASMDGNMALCGMNKPITNLLAITHMDRIFCTAADEQEAQKFLEEWKIKHD